MSVMVKIKDGEMASVYGAVISNMGCHVEVQGKLPEGVYIRSNPETMDVYLDTCPPFIAEVHQECDFPVGVGLVMEGAL